MQYKIINQETGKEQIITIPSQFKNAEVVNLVLGWSHSDNDPEDLFQEPDDNRDERKSLMKKLRGSIPKYGQLQPATVNPEGKIWEGNHRFKVTKEFGEQYLFMIDNGFHKNYQMNQDEFTDEINEVREDYTIEDWLNRYVNRYQKDNDKYFEYESYNRFQEFLDNSDNKSIYNNLIYFAPDDSGRGELKKKFIDGTFNPTESQWAKAIGYRAMIDKVGNVWGNHKAVKLSYFMVAYIKLLQGNDDTKRPNFSHPRFINQLKANSYDMRACANSTDYITQINVIYNKGKKYDEKVWLA